jgi:hypothetical protein
VSALIEVLRLLPELIRLIKAIEKSRADQASAKDLKESVVSLRKAIEEKDEKAINDLFASLDA